MIIQLDINFQNRKLAIPMNTHKQIRRGTGGGGGGGVYLSSATHEAAVYRMVQYGDLKTLRLVVVVYLPAHESRRGKVTLIRSNLVTGYI